jgi:hypothetical protein
LAHLNLPFIKMLKTCPDYFQTKVWIQTWIWIHSSHLLNPDLPGSGINWNIPDREGEDDCPVSAELPEGAGPDLPEERERGVQRLQQHQWVGGYMDQRYMDQRYIDTERQGPNNYKDTKP